MAELVTMKKFMNYQILFKTLFSKIRVIHLTQLRVIPYSSAFSKVKVQCLNKVHS